MLDALWWLVSARQRTRSGTCDETSAAAASPMLPPARLRRVLRSDEARVYSKYPFTSRIMCAVPALTFLNVVCPVGDNPTIPFLSRV
jgi:hypothetical protein